MCDTLYASREVTEHHVSLFGKNSDRQRNEAQLVELVPAGETASGTQLRCSYLTIPQSARRHAVLLSRPFWSWGAEMGANEHGVVIGNEGIHSRGHPPQQEALTGMDLVRLGLERGETAMDAVEVITSLLEEHGQGGNCGHLTPSFYHNGFLIADAVQAFVLETIDREWILEEVNGVRTLSNIYSIGCNVTRTSSGVSDLIRAYGLEETSPTDYARAIANPDREHIGQADARRTRSGALLKAVGNRLSVHDIMSALRDHGPATDTGSWHPSRSPHISVCMHAGAEGRVGQTVGSLVSEIRSKGAIHWVTATSAPCISIYKPILIDAEFPAHGSLPTDSFNSDALWWWHERMHRSALEGDFEQFLNDIQSEREALESSFRSRIGAVIDGGNETEKSRVVSQCWHEAFEMEKRWQSRVPEASVKPDDAYIESWSDLSVRAGLTSSRTEL